MAGQINHKPQGMKTFMVIWLGQLISLVGSGLTSFALGVWLYEQTGEATPFAVTVLFGSLPRVLLSPIAGVVADRWNRRWVMILADTGAALTTVFVAGMLFFGELQIWHVYLMAAIASSFGAFQQPAYTASVAMLVPKKDLGRANGLVHTSQAIEMLAAPLLAGALFGAIGLRGIILIDFATFFFAVGALLIVHIPQPESLEAKEKKRVSLDEMLFGWRYLTARSGLFSMLIYFAMINFLLNLAAVLTMPLVLSFSSAAAMGLVQMVGGLGLLVGSVVMSAWGGPKRRMLGVYGFIAVFGVAYMVIGLQPSAWLIGAGMFVMMGCLPVASGSNQAIWQSKVEPAVQGRVFAVRSMLATAMMPLAFLLAGPLADRVFDPLLLAGGPLAGSVGQVTGVGPGRGIGLLYILVGVLVILTTAAAYAYPRMRLVEDELPDVLPDEPPVGGEVESGDVGVTGEVAPAV